MLMVMLMLIGRWRWSQIAASLQAAYIEVIA